MADSGAVDHPVEDARHPVQAQPPSRRNFKDLFAGRKRRTRPGEFWALRDVSFTVAAGRGDRGRRPQRPGQVDAAQAGRRR